MKLLVNTSIAFALLTILAHFFLASLPLWLCASLLLLSAGAASVADNLEREK